MNQTDISHIKSFFNSWSIYDKIVHHNYMAHNEIFTKLNKFFTEFSKKDLNVLDLGCGDCTHIPATLDETRIKSYTGVDISSAALSDAQTKFKNTKIQVRFIEDDFVNCIRSCEDSSFSLVIAGYSAHHLFYDNKQEFFDHCFRVLESGGCFVHYDVQRSENETHEKYLEKYYGIIDCWEKLDSEEKLSVKWHISQCDYPSTLNEIIFMAENSGFSLTPGILFTDEHQIHTLTCFMKY